MSQLRERFIRDLRIRNYSKRTIENYVGSIARLGKFYNQCPSEISSDQIKEYLNYCFKRGQSWSSVNIIMSACNRLYKDTLNQSEKLQTLKRPKTEKKLPVVLSEEEVVLFLGMIRNVKHRAIMMTIYSAGLRCGEACNLKVRDIDSKRDRIIIRDAKGHKDREVILSQKLLNYLRHYVRMYRPKDYLFYGQNINSPISNSSLRKILKSTMQKCGILKKTTLHSLRHSYATHLMDKGIDIRIIQRLLGHKSVKTTMLYCHLSKDRFGKTRSPLDDLPI